MPRLTLKIGRAGANLRADRDLERVPTQAELDAAADAAAGALGIPSGKRARRLGSDARTKATATTTPIESAPTEEG